MRPSLRSSERVADLGDAVRTGRIRRANEFGIPDVKARLTRFVEQTPKASLQAIEAKLDLRPVGT